MFNIRSFWLYVQFFDVISGQIKFAVNYKKREVRCQDQCFRSFLFVFMF